MNLAWAQHPVAAGYNVYRNGKYLNTITSSGPNYRIAEYKDNSAPASGSIGYYITAFDASKKNFSPRSNIITVIIAGVPLPLTNPTTPIEIYPPTIDEDYSYYKETPEGREILIRESPHGLLPNTLERKKLFVARVRYNRNEGGVELFNSFMPNRIALTGSARADYDSRLNRIHTDIKSRSALFNGETFNLPGDLTLPVPHALDPSLQFIIASAFSEAIGNIHLAVRVLNDIDRGWVVSLDGSEISNACGRHSLGRQNYYHAVHKSITFKLSCLIRSYVRPKDTYDLVAHEVAHALDGYNRSSDNDGIPSEINGTDKSTILRERHELFTDYVDYGEKNGLSDYTFKDRSEFWADISMYFLSGKKGARIIYLASPDLYGVLSRFYVKSYCIDCFLETH